MNRKSLLSMLGGVLFALVMSASFAPDENSASAPAGASSTQAP